MSPATASKELESSLQKLSVEPKASKHSRTLKKKQVVTESWDDEELESGEETDRPLSTQQSVDYPAPPPPTPTSAPSSFLNPQIFTNPYGYEMDGTSSPKSERLDARPEKTDTAAKRMIAAALGVRVPPKTQDQKEYDNATKEKELRKRKQEKEAFTKAKDEAEKARLAVWND